MGSIPANNSEEFILALEADIMRRKVIGVDVEREDIEKRSGLDQADSSRDARTQAPNPADFPDGGLRAC